MRVPSFVVPQPLRGLRRALLLGVMLVSAAVVPSGPVSEAPVVEAAGKCKIIKSADLLELRSNCVLSKPLMIPLGVTFRSWDNPKTADADIYRITLRGPIGKFSDGGNIAVGLVAESGGEAAIERIIVDGKKLTKSCQPGAQMYGIYLDDSPGRLSDVAVNNVNRGQGCGVGIGVEVFSQREVDIDADVSNSGAAGLAMIGPVTGKVANGEFGRNPIDVLLSGGAHPSIEDNTFGDGKPAAGSIGLLVEEIDAASGDEIVVDGNEFGDAEFGVVIESGNTATLSDNLIGPGAKGE